MKTAAHSISSALIGGICLLILVIAGAAYALLLMTKPTVTPPVSKQYPTQVLETAFDQNGVFQKTTRLNSSASTDQVTNAGNSESNVGKTDLTSFE